MMYNNNNNHSHHQQANNSSTGSSTPAGSNTPNLTSTSTNNISKPSPHSLTSAVSSSSNGSNTNYASGFIPDPIPGGFSAAAHQAGVGGGHFAQTNPREASITSLDGTPQQHEFQQICSCKDCVSIHESANYTMLDNYLRKHLAWQDSQDPNQLQQQAVSNTNARTVVWQQALAEYMAAHGVQSPTDRGALSFANARAAEYGKAHGLFAVWFSHVHTIKPMTKKTRDFPINIYLREQNHAILSQREAVRNGEPYLILDPNVEVVSTRDLSRRGHADKPLRQQIRIQAQKEAYRQQRRNSGGSTASGTTTPAAGTTPPLGPAQAPHSLGAESSSAAAELPPLAPPMAAGTPWFSGSSGSGGADDANNDNNAAPSLNNTQTPSSSASTACCATNKNSSGATPTRSPITRSGPGGGFFPNQNPHPPSAPGIPYRNRSHQHHHNQHHQHRAAAGVPPPFQPNFATNNNNNNAAAMMMMMPGMMMPPFQNNYNNHTNMMPPPQQQQQHHQQQQTSSYGGGAGWFNNNAGQQYQQQPPMYQQGNGGY